MGREAEAPAGQRGREVAEDRLCWLAGGSATERGGPIRSVSPERAKCRTLTRRPSVAIREVTIREYEEVAASEGIDVDSLRSLRPRNLSEGLSEALDSTRHDVL